MSRTRIKICGITNLEDALAAVEYGADALGFIFVEESPRYIRNNAEALQIPAILPPFINRIAVCRFASDLDNPFDEWEYHCDTIQYYEAGEDRPFDKHAIRCFRIKDESSLEEIAACNRKVNAILLDAYHKDKLGGSGEIFNWELAREAKKRFNKPLILAGGLTPENVGDAIAAVRPYAVDVSSGVESEPGRKDPVKLRAFFEAVRKADEWVNG